MFWTFSSCNIKSIIILAALSASSFKDKFGTIIWLAHAGNPGSLYKCAGLTWFTFIVPVMFYETYSFPFNISVRLSLPVLFLLNMYRIWREARNRFLEHLFSQTNVSNLTKHIEVSSLLSMSGCNPKNTVSRIFFIKILHPPFKTGTRFVCFFHLGTMGEGTNSISKGQKYQNSFFSHILVLRISPVVSKTSWSQIQLIYHLIWRN